MAALVGSRVVVVAAADVDGGGELVVDTGAAE
jgi:hypothetical protein